MIPGRAACPLQTAATADHQREKEIASKRAHQWQEY